MAGPQSDGHELPYIDVNGRKYRLASIPSTKESRAKLMAPSFGDRVGILPRSEWRTISNRSRFNYIMDQKSHGSCVGHGAAGALMRARDATGAKHVDLSGTFVYSYINGNRDQGAMISDAVDVLKEKGTCSYQKCQWDTIYQRDISDDAREEAKRYRALEIYSVGDEDPFGEFVTALMLGFIPVYAVMVGNTFTDLDNDGVCGFDRGPGNHAVTADGIGRRANGEWLIDMVNSWNLDFGQNGRAFITEKHVEAVMQDCFIVRASTDDPQEPHDPPALIV